ncbi:hypothetical protein EDP1_2446 [Pseudomonas putida S610]|nr:hypothetical protein EDP1_2446 [Pseudomonas putida S610]
MNAGFMPATRHMVAYVWRVSYSLRCLKPSVRKAASQ